MRRVDPLEVDVLLDLAAAAGPGAATQLASGRSLFDVSERAQFLVSSQALAEALADVQPLVDAMPRHSEGDLDTAIDLQDAAAQLGKVIPRLQLAIRATESMQERAAIVAVLDAALDAHRQLNEWSSRAAEYNPPHAAEIIQNFHGLVMMAKDLAQLDQNYR